MSPEYRATLRKSQLLAASNIRNKEPLRLACLLLAILSICLSVAIIGTAADVYSTYRRQTEASNPWWLPLWPGHFDTGGAKSQIGAAAGIVLLNGGYVVLCLIPKLNFHAASFRAMMSAVMLSTGSSLIGLSSIVYSAILNRSTRSRDSLQTWTCRFSTGFPSSIITSDGQDNSQLTNDSFDKLCTESKFAFWALVTVVILQSLLFCVAIVQWAMSFWSRTKRSMEDERSGSSTEMESQMDLKISDEFPKQNY